MDMKVQIRFASALLKASLSAFLLAGAALIVTDAVFKAEGSVFYVAVYFACVFFFVFGFGLAVSLHRGRSGVEESDNVDSF